MVSSHNEDSAPPWTRVAILIGALIAAAGVSKWLTGSVVPSKPADALIFQSGLLLVVFGSAVLERKFTRPGDSAVNAIAGVVTMATVYGVAPHLGWWLVTAYCVIVAILALACIVVSTGPNVTGWRRTIADWTYHPAVYFGSARLLYSVVFLFGVFSFYARQSTQAAVLVGFWGVFVALWPLQLPRLLSRIRSSHLAPSGVGRVMRREWPNLVRVELSPAVAWAQDHPYLHQDVDGGQQLIVPLYKQARDEHGIATGLLVDSPHAHVVGLNAGDVYEIPATVIETLASIAQTLGAGAQSILIGFIIEESHIGIVRFETWRPDLCRQGLLVWCFVADHKVYYQVTEGTTREEALESDRLGSQFASAAQLGALEEHRGFVKSDWLPAMNTPVFCETDTFGGDFATSEEGDFLFGHIPGTRVEISGAFDDAVDFHTAIIGVTGSGKTEIAFDLLRHCIGRDTKVICIDLTARYQGRLNDLHPTDLSLSPGTARDLGERLFAAETGPYGAGDEKRALADLRNELYGDVSTRIEVFLTGKDEASRVGIISLDEISNTKATLYVTELFMTCLLRFARDHPDRCPRTLVVVEEAHTVMPETASMGLGDYDSRGLVSKISQIALQGRKYQIGLLVVAQRTATVSKTVLTQCNTIIALSSFDETTVTFLSNVFGRAHAEAVRDLSSLHAIVFGKGVRSQRPVIVEIPFDPEKAEAAAVPAFDDHADGGDMDAETAPPFDDTNGGQDSGTQTPEDLN
jgi:hypothetical protein